VGCLKRGKRPPREKGALFFWGDLYNLFGGGHIRGGGGYYTHPGELCKRAGSSARGVFEKKARERVFSQTIILKSGGGREPLRNYSPPPERRLGKPPGWGISVPSTPGRRERT